MRVLAGAFDGGRYFGFGELFAAGFDSLRERLNSLIGLEFLGQLMEKHTDVQHEKVNRKKIENCAVFTVYSHGQKRYGAPE